jgi:diguanylate cyclase (GGDEF)-like protein
VTERNSARDERDRLLVAERTARAAAEQIRDQLAHLATHDSLTGLRNRLAFEHWLSNALGRRREAHHPVAVCLLDLDRFKLINDGFGHLAGDRLLVEVARRLEHLVRPQDVVARLGGDEFVIGLEDLTPEQVEAVADRALAAVRRPVQVEGRELVVTTTVGIAFGGPDASPETMLRDADVAMYRAKEQGKNRAAIFDHSVRAALLRHLRVEGDLRRGIAGDELLLVHQPNFDLARATRAGAEALVRWEHPELGLLGPAEFVPVAEESDLVVELGLWVLDRAVTQAARWRSEGLDLGGPLWINVSGRQLEDPAFPAAVARALATHDMPAETIALEVTETALLRDPATVNRALDNLVGLGLRIAIDDFGTGYSSLARLATYPLDRLKIDRAFTARLDRDPTNPIVAGAVHLGHALGAVVCAEGVESAAQLRALRALGADQAAGFLLARPVPADELAAAMEAGCSTLASIE